jgi:hypothetical protein
MLVLSGPAWAQQEIADALRTDPVYVASGAEDVDRASLQRSIEEAAASGIDLRVVILAEGNAEQTAESLKDELGATVLVFTPDAYFVSSDVGRGRLGDALKSAADELGSLDTAAGVDALVRDLVAESSGGISVGWVVFIGGVVLLVVGVGGRMWEVRTRASRQAKRRERRRAELSLRAQATGGQVVELSDAVQLAESKEVSGRYVRATAIFNDLDRELAGAASMKDLDGVAERLGEADSLLAEVRRAVRTAREN